MTTLGTKHISTAFIGSYRWIPSNALILCSRAMNLFRSSSFTILPFWYSFSIESMVDETLAGYAGWKCIGCWNSDDTLCPQIMWIEMSYMHIFSLSYKCCFSGFISQGLLEYTSKPCDFFFKIVQLFLMLGF